MFAARVREELKVEAQAAPIEVAVRRADIVVTATASRAALVVAEWVRPGTHISAMGADAPGKQELDINLTASATLVADRVAQSLTIGEFAAAGRAGRIREEDISTLGAVILGKTAPLRDDAVRIFDSSGTAIQDLAIAALAIERAGDAA
jgi:ornithine cyclodeaminase